MSLEQDADDWFTRMRGPGALEARPQFEVWYAVPAHADAYDERVRSFDTVMFLASTATVRNRNLGAARPWVFQTAFRKYAAAAIGLMLAGALVLIVAERSSGSPQSLSRMEVASLEQAPRRISLPDGSTVILDRGSRMQVSFDRRQRRLRLLVGRARFSVAHEIRPFIVEAGAGRIVAHGTLFDVELTQAGVRVALLQGAVEVRDAGAGQGRKRLELAAGQATAIERGSVGEPSKIAAVQSQWPNDMLVLDGVEIGAAVAEFNRTTPMPVLYEVQSGRVMKVTGSFRRSDPEAFARQLAATFGLGVEARQDGSFALVNGPRLQ
ncbi:FecR family protein [Novosphingobium sp.]|uniref:FecR family protein n=1 Tax=Novosphingobium sp. TaxID=1874826 RepID=UPI0025E120B7|nr:FecR domain-containing protein [Novosphingobium sp.]